LSNVNFQDLTPFRMFRVMRILLRFGNWVFR
jgi:hypothetical protein